MIRMRDHIVRSTPNIDSIRCNVGVWLLITFWHRQHDHGVPINQSGNNVETKTPVEIPCDILPQPSFIPG